MNAASVALLERARAQRVVHEALVHRRRAAHGVVPVDVAVHLVLREQQRLERRESLLDDADRLRAARGIVHDRERVEQAVDVDLAVVTPHMNASRLRYSILSRSSEPEISPCSGLALSPRMSAMMRARGVRADRAREHRRDLAAGDQRARDLLVVQRADLLERVRERIVPHVVQQRGAAHERALVGAEARQLAALAEQGERAPARWYAPSACSKRECVAPG